MLLAYITSPQTIRVFDCDYAKQAAFIHFDGTDEDGLEQLHEAGFKTVGSTWDRTGHGGEPCLEVERA